MCLKSCHGATQGPKTKGAKERKTKPVEPPQLTPNEVECAAQRAKLTAAVAGHKAALKEAAATVVSSSGGVRKPTQRKD